MTKVDFPPKIISINLVDVTYNSNLREKKKKNNNNKNKELNTTKSDSSWNKTINKINNEKIEKKLKQLDDEIVNEQPASPIEETFIKNEDTLGQSMSLIENKLPTIIESDLVKEKNIENDSKSKELNVPKLVKRKIIIKNEALPSKYIIPRTKPNNKEKDQTNNQVFEVNKNDKKGLESNKLLKSLDINDMPDDANVDDPDELELERDIIKKTDVKYNKNIAEGLNIIDTIRSSFIKCWTIPYGSKEIKDITVKINVKLDENGNVLKLKVLKNNQNDQIYKLMLQSAVRAIYRCTPILNLPREKFNIWNDIDLYFNPKDSL